MVESVCIRDKIDLYLKMLWINYGECKVLQSWNSHFYAARRSQIPVFFRIYQRTDALKSCGPLLFVLWSCSCEWGKISLSLGAIFTWDRIFSSG